MELIIKVTVVHETMDKYVLIIARSLKPLSQLNKALLNDGKKTHRNSVPKIIKLYFYNKNYL